MKLLILLGAVLGAGIVLILAAIVFQQPELAAEQTEISEPITGSAPVALPQETVAPSETPVLQQLTVEQTTTPTAAEQACRALEQRLEEELDDAQQELNRRQKEYRDAAESYDDALSAHDQDAQYLEQLRLEKEAAEDAIEEAEKDYQGAAKRLSRARIECGLFS
jgi:arginine utilization protein RocB